MNTPPRSTLHALEPQGLQTGHPESLLSYFCRLAVSHAVTTTDLAKFVVGEVGHPIRSDFEWQQRNLSGVGEAARSWAAWLSALTGIGHLDVLTLSNWSAVLPPRGLAVQRGHWCPACLREDQAAGRPPYFRLAWEVGPVKVCSQHKVRLLDTCPHCGRQHVRHTNGVVMPGWCTRCGGFLGDGESGPAEPYELWTTRQVEDLIAHQVNSAPHVDAGLLLNTLNTLILGLDGGQYARFARCLGLAKSTVHNWLRSGGLPSLAAYLAMAGHAGLSLDRVLRGDLTDWRPQGPNQQLAMGFPLAVLEPRQPPRRHDWPAVRQELRRLLKLPEPISVAEAGRRLCIDDRHLYLRANDEARALGERWKQYLASRKAEHREIAKAQLIDALPAIVGGGRTFNLGEVRQALPAKTVASIEGMFDLIREVREEMM